MRDVTIMLLREEFVEGMVHHGPKVIEVHEGCTNIVKNGGVCIRHGAQRERLAVKKDVPIRLIMEEFVTDMVPNLKDAVMR